MGFNLIYWTPICGKTFLDCSILEKCGKIWKNGRFSGRLQPDWGNTVWAAMAGLGSKGLSGPLSYVDNGHISFKFNRFTLSYVDIELNLHFSRSG